MWAGVSPSAATRVAAFGCGVLAAASLLVRSAPTYDPMAWLVWGREVASGELHTTGGPSWKPLPVVFTTVFAAAGDAAPQLWLVAARAAVLGAVVLAFVVARRFAGVLAGCIAGAVLLLAPWMLASGLRGYSEGMVVLFVLAAVERHDRGHPGQAYWFGIGAALLRPEAAAFVALYGLWLACGSPRRLPWIAAGVALVVVLWTLPEQWGSGHWWRAAERAQHVRPGSAALAAHPALEIARLAIKLVTPPGALAAVVAVWLAASGTIPRQARRLVVQLTALSFAWTALVAVMTEAGFAGNWRYLVAPATLTLVLAAAAIGWTTSLILPRFGAAAGWLRLALLGVTAAIAMTYVLLSVPPTVRTYAFEVDVNQQTRLVLARLGGRERLRRCGRIYVNPFLVQRLAWELHQPSMTIAAVQRVPANATGAILRTRVTADRPVLPRRDTARDDRVRRWHTKRWEIELRCARQRTTALARRTVALAR